MSRIAIPDQCLVVLVGVSGSGKSTFAARHFRPTQVLSSDFFRGLVGDDENDQSVTPAAFDALHHVAGLRLAAGRLTVVDATNVQPAARASLVAVARAQHVLPVAIVLDLPERLCVDRTAARTDRTFGREVIARQRSQLRRGLRGLSREGFRTVHVLRTAEEVEAAEIELEPLWTDKRSLTGPFDVIGDVHGCRGELESLLGEMGWHLDRDGDGRAVGASHPRGRTAVFVGDLVDRGPDTPGVLRLVMGMVEAGTALCVRGNHEDKLVKALAGRKVRIAHGLGETLEQLAEQTDEFRARAARFVDGLISHYVLDGGRLVVAHAGLPENYHNRSSGRVRSFALYGDTTGETDEFGLPVRYPWANDYRGRATVLYGHTPTPDPEWVNNTLCLDTGAVFGGALTALRWPERELIAVAAERTWYEPTRPLHAPAVPKRGPYLLDLGDVAGKRIVETGRMGRLTVPAERAAAALEVMSRFAIDPRWLIYLPPTMAPTDTAADSDLLEHPAEAFAHFAAAGATEVVCEEKHMGSRAVLLVTRDDGVGPTRFGIDGPGAAYTRTGRSFFDAPRSDELLLRLRAAVTDAGLWDELDTGWMLLDAELLPWSAKAAGLIREQYAAVGAAAAAALDPAVEALAAARTRGIDVADLVARTGARRANAAAFDTVHRRYTWPTDGLAGVRVAPFQVLATEGRNRAVDPHAWHLDVAARLAATSDLVAPTRSVVVTVDDPGSVTDAVAWWTELTGAGGEGMVVKPADSFVRGTRAPAQPGLKVRGREYLRLIYGPDYTEPANLARVRQRRVAGKRSLALREYVLGLEALDRFVAGEPLWRVHECVFAVLALESEPVDPRL